MKLSYQWLAEVVDLTGIAPEDVGEKITLHTAELEEVISVQSFFYKVYTGKLVSRKPHPDSEKLSVAQFDLGALGTKQIIFGKVHEVAVGEILPIAIAGAKLASGIVIKSNDIRGVASEGMITDNQELGMKNEGILRFPENTKLGEPLSKIIQPLGDTLFDIDNKSLTHRPDLMGHEGFARELSAIFERKKELISPQVNLPLEGALVKVDLQTDVCRRFCAVPLNSVNIQPSSFETMARLENLDIRSISNVVDITNLVLLELGQPMHVFDADKVQGVITVRQAKKGEVLLALDGEEYELTPEDTVVSDEKGPLSIAGIMGGLDSGVTQETQNIIFECANWDPVAVRKTSSRLGLRSDSSMRYEKSLDPEICHRALMRATELALQVTEGSISGPVSDQYPHPQKTVQITLDPDRIRARSGLDLSDKNIQQKLESLDFEVEASDAGLEVTVPTFRATKDVAIAEDLMEEVVRLEGFDNIPSILPDINLTPPHRNHLRDLEWTLRDVLSVRDYLETQNYAFVPESDNELLENDQAVTIKNPLSGDHAQLRRTLLSNLIGSLESELRTHKSLALFEIGKVFFPPAKPLPTEIPRLALLRAVMNGAENDLFYQIKDDLSRIWSLLGITVSYEESKEPLCYAHPAKTADIRTKQGVFLGSVFVLHPQKNPIRKGALAFAEIDLLPLLKATQETHKPYQKLSPFPETHRDLAVLVPERTTVGALTKTAQSVCPALKSIELFDEFTDAQKLGEGVKNTAFHLTFQSTDKTLDESEIEAAFQSIVKALETTYKAKLRV